MGDAGHLGLTPEQIAERDRRIARSEATAAEVDAPATETHEATIARLGQQCHQLGLLLADRDLAIRQITEERDELYTAARALKEILAKEGEPARVEAISNAAQARDALTTLVGRLSQTIRDDHSFERPEGKIRDLAIGVTVLPEAISRLEDLADRELFHKAFIGRHRDELSALLLAIAGEENWDALRYGESLPSVVVMAIGEDEVPPEGSRRIPWRSFHGLRDDVNTFSDRLYRYDED